MKTRLLALLLALTMAFSLPILAAPVEDSQESPLDLNVKAAFLAETTTGQILLSTQSRRPPLPGQYHQTDDGVGGLGKLAEAPKIWSLYHEPLWKG